MDLSHLEKKIMTKTILFCFLALLPVLLNANSLLLNGDFENTSVETLADGRLRFQGWTAKYTNGGYSGIYQEGINGLSAYSHSDSLNDPNDPFFPYINSTTPNLDHFAYARPSGPAPTSSFAELYSDVFSKQGNVKMDVWRESSGSYSEVRFHRASDNALLDSFAFTGSTAVHSWTTVTLDVSGISDGTDLYIVLRGGTYSPGSGWLTFFDNIFGGLTQEYNVPEAGGGSVGVPESSSFFMLLMSFSMVAFYCKRK